MDARPLPVARLTSSIEQEDRSAHKLHSLRGMGDQRLAIRLWATVQLSSYVLVLAPLVEMTRLLWFINIININLLISAPLK